jgi:serine/threonine protein kinase
VNTNELEQDFRDVVYKRVKKHDDKDWEKSLREVKTLRARKHPNVVPLLSSFRTGREYRLSPNDHDMYLYMIQPRADESMEAWMEYKQDSLHTMDQRQRHIRGMMYDLVSAVAYIHATIGEYIAYHHDLKPSNILRFSRGNDSIWKICDFGSSNSKLAQGDTGTDNMMASYIYTPPEYWPRGKNRDLGRTWDVFSLGCIFLELATLYKYGWNKDEGLTKFKERRTYNDDCPFSAEQTLRAKQQDASFFNNMVAVRSWLAHLRDDSSSRFRDILDLIEEMLNERRYERIFAFEVQIHMCQILDRDMDLPALKKLFREISQGPNKSQNGLDRRNNPLRRGKSKKWALDRSLLKILEEKGWNDSTPTSTEEFDLQSSGVLVTDVATTLPGSQHWKDRLVGDDLEEQNMKAFIDTKLYGRTALDEDLRKSFSSGAKRVALYGLWGMG